MIKLPLSLTALSIVILAICRLHLQLQNNNSVVAHAFLCLHSTRTPRGTNAMRTSHLSAQLQSSFYAGAGAPAVDMDRYNLPLERIVDEWTAIVREPSALQEGGMHLTANDNQRELFVDTLQYSILRRGGLGLILTEIAGGREDGKGITIIEEILDDGNAADCGLVPGDSIVALSIVQSNSVDSNEELIDNISAGTECLGYDATVAAISSLPPPVTDDELITLTVKRLRRQPRINVTLQYPPNTNEKDMRIELFAGENLRRAMLARGVKLNDKLAERFDSGGSGDCGSDGTCATCVVGVTRGMELLSPAKIQEGQILSQKPGWRMACKAVVGYGMKEGELTLRVNPRQWLL